MKEGGEEGHEGQREGQELNNRMCSHNLDLETTTQTFMLHARPSPQCPWVSVKRSPHWSCDESKKALCSGDLPSFLVCARKFIWLHAFLFSHVCMWHAPIRTWATERVTTFLTHASSWSVRTFLKQDGVSNDPETFSYVMRTYERVCAHTKTSQIFLPRGLFWAHRRTAGLDKTHSDVNSWPSRSDVKNTLRC
jgi:hypothetical protein